MKYLLILITLMACSEPQTRSNVGGSGTRNIDFLSPRTITDFSQPLTLTLEGKAEAVARNFDFYIESDQLLSITERQMSFEDCEVRNTSEITYHIEQSATGPRRITQLDPENLRFQAKQDTTYILRVTINNTQKCERVQHTFKLSNKR